MTLKTTFGITIVVLMTSLCAQAGLTNVFNFTKFNNVDGTNNTVLLGGSKTGLNSITRTTVGTGDNASYKFACSYTIDGRILTFDLIASGYSGGTVTSALGAIGTGTNGAVAVGTAKAMGSLTGGSITGAAFSVNPAGMDAGETVKFTVTNIFFTGAESIAFNGFTTAYVQETAGDDHKAMVGTGTGLFERNWSAAEKQSLPAGNTQTLYISAATNGAAGADAWGISSLAFTVITVDPEPKGPVPDPALVTVFNFTKFNNVDGTNNTVLLGGSTAGINSITRTTEVDGSYKFACNYNVNGRILTFDLIAKGYKGGTVSGAPANGDNTTGNAGSVAIGTTAGPMGNITVASGTAFAIVGGYTNAGNECMDIGETVKFTVTNVSYAGAERVAFNGFTGAYVQDTTGRNHKVVVGLGSGLFTRTWESSIQESLTTGGAAELYISSASRGSTGDSAWGISSLEFTLTAVDPEAVPDPEPAVTNVFNFTKFNNVDGTNNTVLLGGSKAGLNSITRTIVGGGYKFACNYTVEGRTLKFDLIAKGYQGGTVTGAAAAVGTGTNGVVTVGTATNMASLGGGTIAGAAFGVVGGSGSVSNGMDVGETVEFTVTNLFYEGAKSVTFNGFTAAYGQETAGDGHKAVVGTGAGLFERNWSASGEQSLTAGNAQTLYISSATNGAAGSDAWGISSLEFSITAIDEEPAGPEPVLLTKIWDFAQFNNVNGTNNTAVLGRLRKGLNSITRTTVGTGDNASYKFACNYTIDGRILTFDLIVNGYSGGLVTSSLTNVDTGVRGAVTVGTPKAVGSLSGSKIIGAAFGVAGGSATAGLDAGETLKFTVENLSYEGAQSVTLDGFTAVYLNEASGDGHIAVIGTGTNLFEYRWDATAEQILDTGKATTLYISSAAAGGAGTWGVSSLEFNIRAVFFGTPGKPVVAWTGAKDSNWDVPENWQGGLVPGTGNKQMALLSGVGDTPSAATPVRSKNLYSVKVDDGALLTIYRDMYHFGDILLGTTPGAGGGNVKQMVGSGYPNEVRVAGDIRIGDNPAASSDSSFLISGSEEVSLAVANEIYVGKGTFKVDGPGFSMNAGSMTITTNGVLDLFVDWRGVRPIIVSNYFTIERGAKLKIDLRGYTTGGNEIELVKFGSRSGWFNPEDITIIGLGGGRITYDTNSMNLTVFDDPLKANTLWFIASGGTGTQPSDLVVNTGRRVRDLTSPFLTYTQTNNGNDRISSVRWSGSDFDGDGFNDVISFDLRVEGFTGSTYTYSATPGASSMTALGAAASVRSTNGMWGVGGDADLDAGESLRFSVENVTCSTAGGVKHVDGFVAFQINEIVGSGHKLVIGQGTGLNSVSANTPKDVGFDAMAPLVVTSAGNSQVTIGNVVVRFIVSELPDFLGADSHDYSGIPNGPDYRRPDYPAETNFLNYPSFSWDTVQRWATMTSSRRLTDAEAQAIVDHHQIINIKGNYGLADAAQGLPAFAAHLRTFNPNIKCMLYFNSVINYGGSVNDWSKYTLGEGDVRIYGGTRDFYDYNHAYPELRQWWINHALSYRSNGLDGIFIDKAGDNGYRLITPDGQIEATTGLFQMYCGLAEQSPPGTLMVANAMRSLRPGGNRELMNIFTGSYMERWDMPNPDVTVVQRAVEARCASLQIMREAAMKGKILLPNVGENIEISVDAPKEEFIQYLRDHVGLGVAYYLIVAERYTYLRYQPEWSVDQYPEWVWDPTDYVPELTNPVGPPLGPPVRNGYIYTRSFEHVDVRLDVENETEILAWDSVDSDGDGLSDLWEFRNFGGLTNAIATANPDGDAYNNYEEYIAGLNPNVFDAFVISSFTAGASNTYTLKWNALAGRGYNIYWTSNLLNGFTLIRSNAPGGQFIVTNPPTGNAGFYKISVKLQPQ